jgi:4-hydroxy 2-oxovalerate aldolase
MPDKKPEILDCTIRDGGLINNHRFSRELVRAVYRAVAEAGVDYVELGYRNSREQFPPEDYGAWKFSSDKDIEEATAGIESRTRISLMADAGRCRVEDFQPAASSPVDMIRVASYVKDIDEAIALSNTFADMGYETTINIMAVSRDSGRELDDALRRIEDRCRVDAVYVVDSFGALYRRDVEALVDRYRNALKSKKIGFHGHNNQQLAFANTIEAIDGGVDLVDGTVYGIGRAAGNCPLELLLGYLESPVRDLKPVLGLIEREFIPMREELEWGYIIPYALTAMENEHPRAAMELRQSERKDDYVGFLDSLMKRDKK